MPAPSRLPDDLLARVRERAADPERRTDGRPSVFGERVASMSLGQLLGQGLRFGGLLRSVVSANKAGRPVPQKALDAAFAVQHDMETPVDRALPAVATDDDVLAAERILGFPFPEPLVQLATTVANGGFGPGGGLFSLQRMAEAYRGAITDEEAPRGQQWPRQLLPILDRDPGYDTLDLTDGRVVTWDPEDLHEFASTAEWRDSFIEDAPSLEAWLTTWLRSKSFAEQQAEIRDRGMEIHNENVARLRAQYSAMTPEERRAQGVSDETYELLMKDWSQPD